jgi:hypothetical protein
MEDQQETVGAELVTQEDAQEEQSSVDDNTDISDAEQQPEVLEEKVYAGKYKSIEDLEKSYKELESKLGGYKEVEEKARAFDQLSKEKSAAPVNVPDLNQFTDQYGNIDTVAFNNAMNQYQGEMLRRSQESARQSAREEIDSEKSQREFPYLATDRDAADAVVALYQSGRAGSLYEAAKRLDKIRKAEVEGAVRDGAHKKEKEIARKMLSSTERASGKSGDGISQEAFGSMSLAEKKAFLERM